MREIIDILESVGLANRRRGDRFANDQGTVIFFNDLSFFPESGAYSSEQEMVDTIDRFAQQINVPPSSIAWINQPRGAQSFAIAHFVDESNKDYYIGKYFKSISPNRSENNFPNNLPGGFKLQTKAAKKEASGYKPTEILTKLDDLTPADIYQQVVLKFGENSDEANAMAIFMQAGSMPAIIPRGNMDADAFSNYFCELLQPMALVMGKPVKGNAADAEKIFLSKGGFDSCTISFGAGQNTGLSDSALTNPAGQSIIVSSKAKGGAWAAASNLKEKVDEARTTDAGKKLIENNKKTIATLDMIVDGGYIDGPLNVAMAAGMITPEEKEQVKSLRKLGPQEIVGKDFLSPKLEEWYEERKSTDPRRQVPFYHMLAAVAHKVADWVNENTDFSETAAAILNQSALVQMYTNTAVKGNEIVLKEFRTVYPSQAVTGVMLRAGKTYYSTANKGNFTFEILKNGAESTPDEDENLSPTDTKPDIDLDQVTQRRTSVRPIKSKDVGDELSLGRKRRKR